MTKYKMSLLELKWANVRQSSKAMAEVLGESFNKAVAHFSSSPKGLSDWLTPCVIAYRRDQSCLQNNALIVNQSEGQILFRLSQRLL